MKTLKLLLAVVLLFALTACGGQPATPGQILYETFQEKADSIPDGALEDLATDLVEHEIIPFDGAVTPVEPGLLTGFGNQEITGFAEGVMYAPVIGSIPFVGYLFRLAPETDGEAFMKTLEAAADPQWNVCTKAEETVIEQEGDKVFFLMCPSSLEE